MLRMWRLMMFIGPPIFIATEAAPLVKLHTYTNMQSYTHTHTYTVTHLNTADHLYNNSRNTDTISASQLVTPTFVIAQSKPNKTTSINYKPNIPRLNNVCRVYNKTVTMVTSCFVTTRACSVCDTFVTTNMVTMVICLVVCAHYM